MYARHPNQFTSWHMGNNTVLALRDDRHGDLIKSVIVIEATHLISHSLGHACVFVIDGATRFG
jgi:hypothetical protein